MQPYDIFVFQHSLEPLSFVAPLEIALVRLVDFKSCVHYKNSGAAQAYEMRE